MGAAGQQPGRVHARLVRYGPQIFGVEETELLRPAPRRQLLAALLGELRDAHWAAAAGCAASPAAMTPLTPSTALENKVWRGDAETRDVHSCLLVLGGL